MARGRAGPEFPLRWLGWVWLVSGISSAVMAPLRMVVSRRLIDDDGASTDRILEIITALGSVSFGISLLVYGFAIAGTAILMGHVKRAPRGAAPASKVALVGLIVGVLLMGANYVPWYFADAARAVELQMLIGNITMLVMIAVLFGTAWAALAPLREFAGRSSGLIALGVVMVLEILVAPFTSFVFRELSWLMWFEFALSVASRLLLAGLLLSAASHVVSLRVREAGR